ncbi:DUF4129 domain-containing protein [Mycobacterium yunnanensis]|uniref:DUF4129 domain-containing protein n=1 Tax=Mycobacterium yunnanensis TaxID=368477 RepID=A0A9X2YMZ8_9MYCO|nr:DUF4129 domain-containing protein [Mycobacterium yunnanensis]MCV7422368.1 DUF4129 domain-containing protein [Mycobacterium yunnanensis]
MSIIDIDRDAAHDAAQRELSKPIYPRGSLTDQLSRLLEDLLFRVMAGGASVPGGWITIAVLSTLVAVAAVVAFRVARRTMRTNRRQHATLFGSAEMSSVEHRAAAELAASQGDWAMAIKQRLRAVARNLEEAGVVQPVPGRTATELARDVGHAVPRLTDELRRAATVFNDVTYGEQHGTETGYRVIADLDEHLLHQGVGKSARPGASGAVDGWAEVR